MLNLYRLYHPYEAKCPWLSHSLVSLAAKRSDLYRQADFTARMAVPQESAAIYVVLSIDRVAQVLWALSQPDVKRWVEAGVPIIFDDSAETGLSNPDRWLALRQKVDKLKLARCNLVWLLQNERGPQLCSDAFSGHPTIHAQAVVLHYWMHQAHHDAERTVRPARSERTARFICLNTKLRLHRAAVLGNLINTGLFDKGMVSLAKQTPGSVGFGWPTFEAFETKGRSKYPAFAADIAAVRPLLDRDHGLGSGNAESILRDLHAKAGFSLVNETEMSRSQVIRFTEKVLKPLATWHPFVVAGNPGTLKLLRQIGFKTFAPFIDEAYDDIIDPQERLSRVLAVARRLITMPEVDFDDMLDRMEPILDHNVNHFFDGLPSIMEAQHAAFLSAVKQ